MTIDSLVVALLLDSSVTDEERERFLDLIQKYVSERIN